ncbi:MAG: XdhC family protein [Candidatus Competibacteraceae bacterium]|jgi:xanthine dehydrogenase accessory factor|nr:XdhC family protein [Candidatus Competibacteraceae bacterium]
MDSMDIEVLRNAVAWLQAGRRVALVTVAQTWGSAPRPVGALLAMADDGRLSGSVSGGCIEDDLGRRIHNDFPTRCEVMKYGVTAEEARQFGLPCGGTLQLVVEPLSQADALEPLLAAVERRELIMRRLQLSTGAAIYQAADKGLRPGLDGDILIQLFGPRWRLLLIGASQTSLHLARMAQALDYRVYVCDPREEYRQSWERAEADWLSGMPDDVVRELSPDQRTAILALTHDPKLDDMALMEALRSDAFYIGALGSKLNNAKRRKRLLQLDLTQAQIDRLHGPVGLPIGSRTPPEIALSILAELVALRNGMEFIKGIAPQPASLAAS